MTISLRYSKRTILGSLSHRHAEQGMNQQQSAQKLTGSSRFYIRGIKKEVVFAVPSVCSPFQESTNEIPFFFIF
jgi:hypothetical protein